MKTRISDKEIQWLKSVTKEQLYLMYRDNKYCSCDIPSTDFNRAFCFKCKKELNQLEL
jgi:hypothetical protein